jgi:hypothetical protein
VSVFDTQSNFMGRSSSTGTLNSPWGLALAPSSFGSFAGDLLVGNFGDGAINAFDLTTNSFVGQLPGLNGKPLTITPAREWLTWTGIPSWISSPPDQYSFEPLPCRGNICEPTTHRLVRRVFLPTTHRLLESQPEPTLPPTELSSQLASWVHKRSRAGAALRWASVLQIAGNARKTRAFGAGTVPVVGRRFAVARNQRDDPLCHESLSQPIPIDAMRCRLESASDKTMRCRKTINDALSVRNYRWLWALIPDNGCSAGDVNTIYFSAGPGDESHGLFGALSPIPEPSSVVLGLVAAGLLAARWRYTARKATAAVVARTCANRT